MSNRRTVSCGSSDATYSCSSASELWRRASRASGVSVQVPCVRLRGLRRRPTHDGDGPAVGVVVVDQRNVGVLWQREALLDGLDERREGRGGGTRERHLARRSHAPSMLESDFDGMGHAGSGLGWGKRADSWPRVDSRSQPRCASDSPVTGTVPVASGGACTLRRTPTVCRLPSLAPARISSLRISATRGRSPPTPTAAHRFPLVRAPLAACLTSRQQSLRLGTTPRARPSPTTVRRAPRSLSSPSSTRRGARPRRTSGRRRATMMTFPRTSRQACTNWHCGQQS